MVKQRATDDGTVAMDCGVCVIAMLTDLPYEKVLADNPNYQTTSDRDWMRYLNLLGFQVDQVDENTHLLPMLSEEVRRQPNHH